jgi:FAD:protein FMN transferase
MLVTVAGVGAQPTTEAVRRTAVLMGTSARIEVEAASRAEALSASEAVLRTMVRVERQLSTWRDDSELSRLNRTPAGVAATPTRDVAILLSELAGWTHRTGGALQPTVGALIDAWDFRGQGRRPSDAEIERALRATGDGGIEWDRVAGTVTRLDQAAWIDAGSFGKGAALRAAADTLRAREIPSAVVDLGGQLLVLGSAPLPVGVAHPRERSRALGTVRVLNASVATSGQSERGIEVDGDRYGHLLDPRTGLPVSAWGSVTVVATDPFVADVLSTALYVMGPGAGMDLAVALDDVGVLFLEVRRGDVRPSMNATMAGILEIGRADDRLPSLSLDHHE